MNLYYWKYRYGNYSEIQERTAENSFSSFFDVFPPEDGIKFGSKIWYRYNLDGYKNTCACCVSEKTDCYYSTYEEQILPIGSRSFERQLDRTLCLAKDRWILRTICENYLQAPNLYVSRIIFYE